MNLNLRHGWIRQRIVALAVALAVVANIALGENGAFVLDGVTLTLSAVTNEVDVYFQSLRFNRAINAWNVEVWATNKSSRTVQAPLVLRVESFTGTSGPLQPDGQDTNHRPFYDLTRNLAGGSLAPGQRSSSRTLTLGLGAGSPQLSTRFFEKKAIAATPAALVRSLNEVGQPLPGVTVQDVLAGVTNTTDPTFGVATLAGSEGEHLWKFTAPGYWPAWRRQTLNTGEVAVIASPRLTPQVTNEITLTPIAGGTVAGSGGSVQVTFPPGAFAQDTTARLTPLTGQTLPAFPPQGWSPLQAFWLDLTNPPALPGTASLLPWGPIGAGETAALARWDLTACQWQTLQLLPGNGMNRLTGVIPAAGCYVLVVADPASLAPPPPQPGQALQPSAVPWPDASALSASGSVNPVLSTASRVAQMVTATAAVTISNQAGVLPSGLILRGETTETCVLRDGTHRTPPQYENFMVGYQRPGDSLLSTLSATFPMRPLLLFGAEDLANAVVRVDIMGPGAFSGGLLDETGGVVAGEGVRVLAGQGDLGSLQALQLRSVSPTNFSDFTQAGVSILRAFEFIGSGVAPGRKLTIQFDALPTNGWFVLAKVLSSDGYYGLEPRERLGIDSQGQLTTLEPAMAPRLPGIDGAGQYVLAQVGGPQALVTGIAHNSAGQPAGGLAVRLSPSPWLTFSDPDGQYRLVAPTGAVQVAVLDPRTGDTGQTDLAVTNGQGVVVAAVAPSVSGPVATLVSPTNGAVAVPRVIPVVVSFSHAINPGSLGTNGIQLLDGSNQPVNASLTLNLRNTSATLLPEVQLAPTTLYTVVVSPGIADLNGRALAGTNQFFFTTTTDNLDHSRAQLISYEPTNGLAPLFGTAGTAEPNAPVILVNETSGRTATVLARADGSFTNVIEAGVDDFLSAVLVNQNGTRNVIPVSRQVFRDGSVGLFNAGGILEAQSDGGPVQVLVQPGTIPQKAKFKIDLVSPTQLAALMGNSPPQTGQVLGGMVLSQEGDELSAGADLSFAVNPASLNLPAGVQPEDASFALVVPHEFEDGNVNYEIIDRMVYQNGSLVTHSPPFLGLLLKKIQFGDALARKVDKMSGKILGLLGLPDLQTATTHMLALPIMLAQGNSITLFGHVSSLQADPNGDPITGTDHPVPGAFVTGANDSNGGNNPATLGKLNPGQFFCTAGSDGRYSFYVPLNSLEAQGFLLTAIHPRFPHQRAIGGAVAQNLASRLQNGNVLSVPLYFVEVTGASTNLGPDTDAPLISVAQTPWDPRPGTNAAAGVLLSVVATDDRAMASLDLATNSVALLNPLESSNRVAITTLSNVTVGAREVAGFWITSEKKAQVSLSIIATDGAGNTNTATYNVVFDGDKVQPAPVNTNDHVGPRVVACWPRNGAAGVPAFDPIHIRFSEPILADVTTNIASWLQFSSPQNYAAVDFSPDYREMTIHYSGAASGLVSLSLGQGLTDVNGNPLDNDPSTTNLDNFNLSFNLAGEPAADLSGITTGGGVVTKGGYAYALERTGDLDGAVVVYDLTNPSNAVKVAALKVPGYPRDLALIPQYVYTPTTSKSDAVTNDLLAVVGGKVGDQDFQYLWVLDIGNPLNPTRLASAVVTFAQAAVVKIKWSPPFLAYLETGADSTSISLVNLQTFIIGSLASQDLRLTFTNRVAGLDADGDGNFCGPNDELPLPFNSTSDYYGRVTSYAIGDTTQPIIDFDLDSNLGLLGVTLGAGKVLGSTGQPTAVDAPPAYRTLVSGLADLDPTLATFSFDQTDYPRRLTLLSQVPLQTTNAGPTFRNIALVSLDPNASQPGRLMVVDITDPLSPTNLAQLTVPSASGNLQSILRRDDGLLALATMQDVFLLDPTKLLLPNAPGSPLPAAIVGIIEGAGGGTRSFASGANGVNVVNFGGKHQVIRTTPKLDIVSFPTLTPGPAQAFRQWPEAAAWQRLRAGQSQALLIKNRFAFSATTNAVLTNPPLAATHYYVRVDAPGAAGTNLDLYVEAWGANGTPLPNGSSNALPVHLGSPGTRLAIGDTNQSVFPATLKAWRMSDDPRSACYNVYLSDPFVVSDQTLNAPQRGAVSNQLARAILRAGKSLWAGFDPGLSSNTFVGPFASGVSNQRVKPGDACWAEVENTERPLVLIPGIAGSYLENTNSGLSLSSERWLGWLESYQRELNLNPTGTVVTSIMPGDIVRSILNTPGFDLVKIYGPLIDFLTTQAGYVEYHYDRAQGAAVPDKEMYRYRTVGGADYSQLTNNPNLFIFPYDWRLNNAVTADKLKEYIQVIRRFHPEADKVDILAHSMGGLVARRFIIENPGTVDKLITVGTPWLGAPKAIAALERGDFDDLAMNIVAGKDLLKQLAEFMPGIHQLLPSQAYFDLGGRPLAEGSWNMNLDTNYFEVYDYPAYAKVMNTIFHTNNAPVLTNEGFHAYVGPTNQPPAQQNQQDNWANDSTEVDYYHVYGVQAVPRTLGQVRGATRLRQATPRCSDLSIELPWEPSADSDALLLYPSATFEGHDRFLLDRRFEYARTSGDGTVPELSASRISPAGNYNAPSARVLPLYSPSPARDKEFEHNGLLANTNLFNLVQDILNGFEPAPAAVQPPTNNSFLVVVANAVPDSFNLRDDSGHSSDPWLLSTNKLVNRLFNWFTEEDENPHVAQYQILNTEPGNTKHTLSFDIGDQPMGLEAYRLQGGVITNLYRWVGIPVSNTTASVTINWSQGTAALRLYSTNVPAVFILTNAWAQDELPPRVTNFLQIAQSDTLDAEANEKLLVNVHDAVFETNQLDLYLAFDRSENSSIFDDVFRPVSKTLLTTNTPVANDSHTMTFGMAVPALQTKPITVVADNAAGNVSPEQRLSSPAPTPDDSCAPITREKAAALTAIQEGLAAVNASGWVLTNSPPPGDPPNRDSISYIFELGSGACFWSRTPPPCDACDGVFTPNVSDHDYVVYLPVFTSYYSGPPPTIAVNPYLRSNVEGDWYFRPPVTNAAQIIYNRPDGSQTVFAYDPAKARKTPADFISDIFTTAASNSLYQADLKAAAANINFYTGRAEHFENGTMDLELPFPGGADPLGDAGMGRQLLVLKYVLEGAFVDINLGGSPPDLDAIYMNLKARGIKVLEGYEWAYFQEFAALGSGLLLRTTDVEGVARGEYPTHDFFYDKRKKQIKYAGKAAIRTIMGVLAAAQRNDLIFIDRATYKRTYPSFEHYIAGQAVQAMDLFSALGLTAEDITHFRDAKVANKAYLGTLLTNQCEADKFLAKAVKFCREAQNYTRGIYDQEMSSLAVSNPDEYQTRSNNLYHVQHGFTVPLKAGLDDLRQTTKLDLPIRVINDGPIAANGCTIDMRVGAGSTIFTTNLPPDTTYTIQGVNHADGPFLLVAHAGDPVTPVRFVLKGPSGFSEPVTTNNWFGFRYYVLDVDHPDNGPACSAQTPLSPPSDLPTPDASCQLQ